MGHAGGDGQKAIRLVNWCLGVQSGLVIWICQSLAINEPAWRGIAGDGGRCWINHHDQRCPTGHMDTTKHLRYTTGHWPISMMLLGRASWMQMAEAGPSSIIGFSITPEERTKNSSASEMLRASLTPLTVPRVFPYRILPVNSPGPLGPPQF